LILSLAIPLENIVGTFTIVIRIVRIGANFTQLPFGADVASGHRVHHIVGTKPTVWLFTVEKLLAVLDVLLETILAKRDGHVLEFHNDIAVGTSAFATGAGIIIFKLG
jgi:hypothetical protein